MPTPSPDETGAVKDRGPLAIAATALWFILFSAGALLDSGPYREANGWKAEEARSDTALLEMTKLVETQGTKAKDVKEAEVAAEKAEKAVPKDENATAAAVAARAKATQLAKEQQDDAQLLSKLVQFRGAKGETGAKPQGTSKEPGFGSFVASMFLFIPTNVALLTLLAGFIGGCASNRADISLLEEDLALALEDGSDPNRIRELKQRIAYMKESPVNSLVRALIVYLIFISGLYIASADPFSSNGQTSQLAQYLRLAGLLSVLGFMVGYDPSRFRSWLELVPSPQVKRGGGKDQDQQKDPDAPQTPIAAAEATQAATHETGDAVDHAKAAVNEASKAVDKAQAAVESAAVKADKAEGSADTTVGILKDKDTPKKEGED